MAQDYQKPYHTYPILAEEFSFEGSFKRYTSFPTPKDVYDFVMKGIPKKYPLTGEPILPDDVAPYLESAINEIEMSLGCNLSETTHFHSEDWWEGMFTNNLSGIRLQHWPATKIEKYQLKYPHTNTTQPYQTYTVPPKWIFLRFNRLNIVASDGSVQVYTDNAGLSTSGLFTYITGFNRGIYGPGAIEVVYKAGFEQDKLPTMLADLIKTWAGINFLQDILPMMFPQSSVQVGIDSVSQSVGLVVQQLIGERIKHLKEKKASQSAALQSYYGRQVKMSFIGS